MEVPLVATSKDHSDNSFYGLAIGFTVLLWTYLVVQLAAGAAAGIAFRVLNPSDK